MTTINALDRGRLDRLHRTAGPLADALAAVPEYARLRAEHDRLAGLPVPTPRGTAAQVIGDALAAELTTETPDLQRVLEVARVHAAETAAAELVADAMGKRRTALANDLDMLASSRAADVFAHLDGQLQAVLEEATTVLATLGDVRTADDALAARDKPEVVAAWQRFPELDVAYDAIRGAQATLWRLTDSTGRNLRNLPTAFLAAPEVTDPEYLHRRGRQRIPTPAGGLRDPRPAPWPDLWSGDALRWCVDNPDARPWVPTPRQLAETEERLMAATRRLVSEHTETMVRA